MKSFFSGFQLFISEYLILVYSDFVIFWKLKDKSTCFSDINQVYLVHKKWEIFLKSPTFTLIFWRLS